jgi:hypothetical protein
VVDVTVEFYPSHKLVRQDAVPADTTVRIGEDGAGQIVSPNAGGGGTGAGAATGGSNLAGAVATGGAGAGMIPTSGGVSSAGGAGPAAAGSSADVPGLGSTDTAGCGCSLKPARPLAAAGWLLLGALMVRRRGSRPRKLRKP